MSDEALKAILDREGVAAIVEEHFSEQIKLLEELVDYGTNLIARAFKSSPTDMKATYLLFVHLQQFVAHLDSISVLLKQGCCLSAHLQLRTLLENLLNLKWILERDTDNKIEHIFVANVRSRKHSQSVAIPGTPEAIKHSAAVSGLSLTPEAVAAITKQVANLDKILAEPSRAPINASFETFYKKRGYDPHWYDLCGARSIRQIAIQLKLKDHYDYLYSPFSGVTHGGDIWQSIIFHKEHVEVGAIRDATELPKLRELASTFALETYRLVLNEYRQFEIPNFGRKYLEEWRERHRKVFKVEVKPEFMPL